jgi:hypothetical protein
MIRTRFVENCSAAIAKDAATGGVDSRVLEPCFQDLIALHVSGETNEELRQCFVDVVIGEIDAPEETLLYCMRGLRYSEVVEASWIKLGEPPNPRWMNFHSDLVQAMEDEIWDDAEFWLHMK